MAAHEGLRGAAHGGTGVCGRMSVKHHRQSAAAFERNITQWLVDSFDRNEDRRDRPAEFAADRGLTAAELLQRLGATLDKAAKVLDRLTTEELLAPYEIQGYKVRGLDAVYQVVEHFAQHYGQVAYITKSLLAKTLVLPDLTKTGSQALVDRSSDRVRNSRGPAC